MQHSLVLIKIHLVICLAGWAKFWSILSFWFNLPKFRNYEKLLLFVQIIIKSTSDILILIWPPSIISAISQLYSLKEKKIKMTLCITFGNYILHNWWAFYGIPCHYWFSMYFLVTHHISHTVLNCGYEQNNHGLCPPGIYNPCMLCYIQMAPR